MTKAELRELLPYGSFQKVATRAGVSKMAVTRYFSDLTKRSPRIEKAALEVAIEMNNEIATLKKQLHELVHA